jgi:DNA-binding MarR family transcriptional regulator
LSEGLTDDELSILRAIPEVGDVRALGKKTGLPPSTLGIAIARLQLKGYVSDDGSLTEKGKEAADSG